jgi:hypothetical protein
MSTRRRRSCGQFIDVLVFGCTMVGGPDAASSLEHNSQRSDTFRCQIAVDGNTGVLDFSKSPMDAFSRLSIETRGRIGA